MFVGMCARKYAHRMNFWRLKMSDPIVDEVRNARMAHTRKFNGDLTAICRDMKSIQATCGHKIVRLPPRKIQQARQCRA